MHKFIVLCALVAVSAVSALRSQQEVNRDWQLFKTKYAKTYASDDEERYRFHIFAKNMFTAKQRAAANPLAQFGVSPYADLSPEEFARRKTSSVSLSAKKNIGAPPPPREGATIVGEPTVVGPKKIDWRTKGAVTKVWNQGQCGDGWAFAAADNIASLSFVQGGRKLPELSAQYIVSCDTAGDGCNGATIGPLLTWIKGHNDGLLPTAESYPYVSGEGTVPACTTDNVTFDKTIQVVGSTALATSENKMADFVALHGPMIVAVDSMSFQTYTGGILTSCLGTQIDHYVLAVGYDLSHDPPYWILKNSWGKSWGEEGYIRVKYGVDACLITTSPYTANIK